MNQYPNNNNNNNNNSYGGFSFGNLNLNALAAAITQSTGAAVGPGTNPTVPQAGTGPLFSNNLFDNAAIIHSAGAKNNTNTAAPSSGNNNSMYTSTNNTVNNSAVGMYNQAQQPQFSQEQIYSFLMGQQQQGQGLTMPGTAPTNAAVASASSLNAGSLLARHPYAMAGQAPSSINQQQGQQPQAHNQAQPNSSSTSNVISSLSSSNPPSSSQTNTVTNTSRSASAQSTAGATSSGSGTPPVPSKGDCSGNSSGAPTGATGTAPASNTPGASNEQLLAVLIVEKVKEVQAQMEREGGIAGTSNQGGNSSALVIAMALESLLEQQPNLANPLLEFIQSPSSSTSSLLQMQLPTAQAPPQATAQQGPQEQAMSFMSLFQGMLAGGQQGQAPTSAGANANPVDSTAMAPRPQDTTAATDGQAAKQSSNTGSGTANTPAPSSGNGNMAMGGAAAGSTTTGNGNGTTPSTSMVTANNPDISAFLQAFNMQAPAPPPVPQAPVPGGIPPELLAQAMQLLSGQPYNPPPPVQQQQQQQVQPSNNMNANFMQSLSAALLGPAAPAPSVFNGNGMQQQQQPFMLPPQQQPQQQPQVTTIQLQPPIPMDTSNSNATGPAPLSAVAQGVAAAAAAAPAHQETKKKRGRTSTFPQSLHQMLSDLEKEGRTEIASFVYNGRAFQIHDPELFVKECIPKYFKMSSLSSFQRQLNLYDFHRIHEGPHQGAYFHRLFVQGHAVLSTKMVRNQITRKKSKDKKKKTPTKSSTKPANKEKKAEEASASSHEDEEDEDDWD